MKQDKTLLKDEIKKGLSGATSVLLLRYTGLTAKIANDLRTKLCESSARFEVVPKRLLIKAASDIDLDLDLAVLGGHIAVIYATGDIVGATKSALEFSKENNNLLELIGGQSLGIYYNAEQVIMLSKLPSLDEMRAQLLATFVAPMSQTVSVMQGLLTAVMHCLQNKVDKENN
ncbi:MAG: 50S ribosomal protein L10 [Chlamydiia bacterium]|nr:50S ribosomal protein L10 [Chlamydiia bacterium]